MCARVILLGSIGLCMTYVTEWLRPVFGDVPCVDRCVFITGIDSGWIWGPRHYWYFWTMAVLFIMGVIATIDRLIKHTN